MNRELVMAKTMAFVKRSLMGAEGGHDWSHTKRVWKMAEKIGSKENCDMLVVELAALLHDIADAKFHGGDETIGSKVAYDFLVETGVDTKTTKHVCDIVANISWKGGEASKLSTTEFKVVQDADRLDGIGAIGIARTFNYGGFKGRELYNPDIPPKLNMTKEEYRSSTAPTLNHFYEKLLLIKDRIHTETGKRIAEDRHKYLTGFLEQFLGEWDSCR